VTSGILVVVLTIAIVMLTRTTYVPLITVEDPDSISAIEEALKERNINISTAREGVFLSTQRTRMRLNLLLHPQD